MDTFANFAYGSNMSIARLGERAPSARVLGVGRLECHALRWHKRGQDGSAKCDALATGFGSDAVWGVLFEIHRRDKPGLDQAEGLHDGYEEKKVEVVTDIGRVTAWAYHATDLEHTLRPFHWYKAFVVSGARQHRLPAPYVRHLEQTPSIPDPDLARATRNSRLLL